MIRAALLSLALLASPSLAQEADHDDHAEEQHEHGHGEGEDHAHDEHVAEASGIRAVHAWANATTASTALVYADLENTSEAAVVLTGAESEIAASAQLVGLENADGELRYAPIPEMPIPAGSEILLAPNGLAIQLTGLTGPLVEGETFEIEFEFGDTHLHATVAVEPAGATQHSHAGHQH